MVHLCGGRHREDRCWGLIQQAGCRQGPKGKELSPEGGKGSVATPRLPSAPPVLMLPLEGSRQAPPLAM